MSLPLTRKLASKTHPPLKLGQQCTLKINAKGVEYLTEAEIGTPGVMKCINETGAPANISIGFYNEAGTKAEPVFVWKHIDKESNLSVHPTSKLQIYAVSDYQATEMITGKINSDIIWERDLHDLAPSTEWNLCYEKNTKKYTIEEVSM
ncbi:hypothetical protein CVT25_011435 [Psilocybe cyanescens]|uniref:Uncharacterized protein n=1 Tax=Psilocybe cyanescens TaxID=93625 RepID=A0A409W2G8_PSICY|nr:hypothetical protein CVT25_011435 [Psilocybe cyanescens]